MFEEDLCSKEFLLSEDHESLYALWTARVCSHKRFYSKLLSSKLTRFDIGHLAELMQLEVDESDPGVLPKLLIQSQHLEKRLSALNPGFNGAMAGNLQKLKESIGLNDIDFLLLGFFCFAQVS
ncbi:hypothetical protein [Thiomicrorhabdus cannonii]|uniref:hypothetical protein n=1 Tax=Thiomicrorhabdus cannonii TaxID=2748011 RepID=UPI0015BB458C|nr:hypothetical protein [Thiomicrorhabdus cannonii]